MAEKVEQYEAVILSGVITYSWREVEITRGSHVIREDNSPGYRLEFEVTRKELPLTSTVLQKSVLLYLGDELCDLDEDEVVPLNKQVNDIAEMQDRQSDFTAAFKVRKTRAMRALFELSGEVGASTTFPYENKICRLVVNSVEVITGGNLILEKVTDQYYYVSIISGNLSFFNSIKGLKITDLTLASTNHTWNDATMAATHAADLDYVYPLCEPSDDGGICADTDTGDSVEIYGGYIWPFIKVKTIWDEIFSNAGYTVTGGNVLTSDTFLKLFMPITSRAITDITKYLYSINWEGNEHIHVDTFLGETNFTGVHLISGPLDSATATLFRLGYYFAPYDGAYTMTVQAVVGLFSPVPTFSVYNGAVLEGTMELVSSSPWGYLDTIRTWVYEVTGVSALDYIRIFGSPTQYIYWEWGVTKITGTDIGFGSVVTPRLHLPAMLQTDFIKMVCNMFGLVPDVTARDHKIRFWNYKELYDNVPVARNWEAYLSETENESEFKFGDYAQNNYMRYRESNDVLVDNGTGIMLIADETLPVEKDVAELPVSTCDEVTIMITNFSVDVSRINFNKYNADTAVYDSQKTIDPRVVYVDYTNTTASPPYEKTLYLTATVGGAITQTINTPKKASSLEVSFSNLIKGYYPFLSRLLTNTNLRRDRFNLPVYEVAGLRHNVPIYLPQYRAYFYVNKISTYVPGKLCTIELIKL